MLASFVRLLDQSGLINFNNVSREEGFDTRFRIQKYVYLAGKFGLENPYNYSIYRYGPYSSSLANDYYRLGNNHEEYDNESQEQISRTFARERFLELVSDKNNDWLEISSTLIDQAHRFNNDQDLINHVESIKCDYSIEYIRGVLTELQQRNIL